MAFRHNFMVRDYAQMMHDQATGTTPFWSVANHDGTYADLGAADGDQKDPGVVVVKITGMTSGGSATVALTLLDCDTSGGTYAALTPVPIAIAATAFDNALFADVLYLPVPDFGIRRYLKLRVAIATAALTAGVLDAWYTKRAQ